MLKDRDGVTDGSPNPLEGCAGCGGQIMDRYYLMAADKQWHANCLRCCECRLPLNTELTCFSRDSNIYCKDDYYRMFCVKRCARCHNGISANELVMRARDLVYHLACFNCTSCGIPLTKGDTFGMRDGMVYCRPHYEVMYSEAFCDEDIAAMFRPSASPNQYFSVGPVQKGRPRKRKNQSDSPDSLQVQSMRLSGSSLDILHPADLNSSMESLSYDSSVASPGSSSGRHSQRTKRMRTSFKHHQLRTMKSYFAINQNPDAKDLKQLAQKTGLSKRVLQLGSHSTRPAGADASSDLPKQRKFQHVIHDEGSPASVWFQNARAKWRRNMMRQDSGVSNGQGGQNGSITPNGSSVSGSLHQHSHLSSATFSDIYLQQEDTQHEYC